MADPIVPHSAPISAYMSVHSATNLAYVRYFAKVENAVSATFKNINAQGFTVSYTLPDDKEVHDAFIEFDTPLTKREEIRPVLENMASEAESALGLPSSLTGPPPLKAIAKAFYAQATDMYTPSEPAVPLDAFYAADTHFQLLIAFGMGTLGLLTFSTDEYLLRQFHPAVLDFKNLFGDRVLHMMWNGAVTAHLVEGLLAFGICVRRGWYSPLNICKWTVSTTLFGFASLSKLLKHAKRVKSE
ncbi:hypothetical protein BDB00DRAFT_966270 [Zychaea mexicana]|uniref:uncharacterized protein n=1 Tax=Zychaea mexicana TaxID=64656 RepID=UPI0022FEC84E|nr:uncharacterized protein BDB00DRAFT_966270 [Zychaea mexicana]KAI9474867.1 hypothetical protein BDB00DRAFT_966270 [Zychaea mexicana]